MLFSSSTKQRSNRYSQQVGTKQNHPFSFKINLYDTWVKITSYFFFPFHVLLWSKVEVSLCFRIEQQFQNVLALWHESHVNMKSVVSWHYLTNEIEAVRAGNVASVCAMSRKGLLAICWEVIVYASQKRCIINNLQQSSSSLWK